MTALSDHLSPDKPRLMSAIVSEKTILALIEDVKKGLECGISEHTVNEFPWK